MDSRRLRERLLSSGLASTDSIQGCSEQELDQIALIAQRPLPAGYRDFMAAFGRHAGRFLRDIEMFFPAVLTLRPDAIEILKDYEENSLVLPERSFVFAMRYKEQFMFFGPDGDDPSVMFYMSGRAGIVLIARSFWDVIERELDIAEELYRQVKGTPYDLQS